jgi:hypothetical protein
MGLTDTWLRAAKGVEKPYKKSDGGGLYILVQPDGKRYWRMGPKPPLATRVSNCPLRCHFCRWTRLADGTAAEAALANE